MPGTSSATDLVAHLLQKKQLCKEALQKELGWAVEPKRPVLCIPCEVSDATGGRVLLELLNGLLELPVAILIIGKGGSSYGKELTAFADAHKNRVAIVPSQAKALEGMYLASDMALFLHDGKHGTELKDTYKNGVVPVALAQDGVEDYNPNQESGTAFTFKHQTVWSAFAGIVRALETYKFPYDWKNIQKAGMGM